ncbi:MAG TPA: hypothetical protein VFG07_03175 [Thermoplasmata archaeon]|nr:hypothetical protein [Thermoplasmata archaeon]
MGEEKSNADARPAPESALGPEYQKTLGRGISYLTSAFEQVAYTVRVPDGMWAQLKARAIRSTLQLLVEHALLLYLGGRPPPNALRGLPWNDGTEGLPPGEYEPGEMRQVGIRLPKAMIRWAKVYAAEADISDQELALRVFDWYLRTGKVPPKREEAVRLGTGFLKVPEKLIGLEYRQVADEQLVEAEDIVEERIGSSSRQVEEATDKPRAGDPQSRKDAKSANAPTREERRRRTTRKRR